MADNGQCASTAKDAQLGANIELNGNPLGFFCRDCTIYHRCYLDYTGDVFSNTESLGDPTCENNKETMRIHRCKPNRCRPCARELKRWQHSAAWKRKLIAKFDRKRHHHIRMITIGLPGVKLVELLHKDSLLKAVHAYRVHMTSEFNRLRRKPIWKNHVDGGMWFFECTTDVVGDKQVKIHPHMHLVVLCPKLFPVGKMNDYLLDQHWTGGISLGRVFINASRNEDGTIKRTDAWDATNYCINYLKKDMQFEGRNRGRFGILCDR